MKHSRGYTLLELLIVLAVLAAIAALMIPAVRGPLDKSRLTSAAQQVQASIAKTRALAVREGVAVQLRYRINGQQLVIERVPGSLTTDLPLQIDDGSNSEPGSAPAVPSQPESLAATEDSASEEGLSALSDSGVNPVRLREFELPSGVTFAVPTSSLSPDQSTDLSADLVTEQSTPTSLQGTLANGQGLDEWSEPIIFQPDGRTRNTTLRLNGQRDFYVQVFVRGLTGTARYTSPQRDSQLSETKP